ncbi:FeoB-associated Cys-rich membrane protein [Crassaminicella profunda]|uniref:FeoB-associated Cys-rich membrane protein n=1 Tax=Crassaminicella profunda TaxID=1286698 RepID=UPI001CA70A82|nr:FeoB-associated Cys-rich membrane protein [Crassaminicella profunda]QZY55395.1 FeoB-associated Cys-rich membrane protein [Crassaminicella profunda]
MTNIIVGVVILSIIGLSIAKIIREKQKGVKCIGCPYAESNNKKGNCSCNIEK